jgi:hypothetical protein
MAAMIPPIPVFFSSGVADEILEFHALTQHVLLVAKVNPAIGDWAAYIDSVPGRNYASEAREVIKTGKKLKQGAAVSYFPDIAQTYQWRD